MTPTTVNEVLRAARAKIRLKRNWCQGVLARDSRNRQIWPASPQARKWCAGGAFFAVCEDPEIRFAARRKLEPYLGGFDIAALNDHEGHAAVMRLFTAAIRKLEEA